MKLNALIVIMFCISSVVKAEIKVDIDMSGRSTTEVTEPDIRHGYLLPVISPCLE